MTFTWLRKVNFQKETENRLIAAQNDAIRIIYAKAEIDNTQKNSRCRLYGDRHETIKAAKRHKRSTR